MKRRLIYLPLGLIAVLCVGFVVLHGIVPAGRTYSELTTPDTNSPWTRGEAVHGEPQPIFDGSAPISDPWIVRDQERYRMWFTLVLNPFTPEQTIGIAHAESDDGLMWTTTGRHVLAPNPDGWDSVGIETACVVRRPQGGWFLYYTAPLPPEGGHHMAIGLATSDDGMTWSRHGTAPLLVGENDWELPFQDGPGEPKVGGILEPCVHFDPQTNTFRMWYAGLGKRGGEFAKYRIGYAESADGITWHRDAEPVFEPSATGGWDDAITSHNHVAVAPDGELHLFYFGSSAAQYQECEGLEGCAMTPGSIGHATSRDGRDWERVATNPILSPRSGAWDSWAVGGPFVLYESGHFRMWYFGNPAHDTYNARIGTATHKPVTMQAR